MKKSILCCIICVVLALTIGLTFTACKSAEEKEQAKAHTVTIESNLPGAGTYTELNAEKKNPGESITLTAFANAGYSFVGWYDGETLLSEQLNYTFQMPAKNIVYTATFERMSYSLSTQTNLPEAGTYTQFSKEAKAFEESVTLTATVKVGYDFLGWFDGVKLLSANLTYEFTMPSKDATYTAKYEKQTYTLTTKANIADAGTFTNYQAKTVVYEESVSLTAAPADEYIFLGWFDEEGEQVCADATYTFDMPTKDLTFTAKFDRKNGWIFSTETNEQSGGTYTNYYQIKVKTGVSVTLTASPSDGFTFLGWYDGETLVSSDADFAFQMPMKDATYTAKFRAFTITTVSNIENSGFYTRFDATRKRAKNTVELSARPFVGFLWQGWYNGETLLSEDPEYSFEMPAADITYIAKFVACPHETLTGCYCSVCGAIAHDYSDVVCTRCGDKMIERVDADGNAAADGDYLYFGTFLQSKVTDSDIVTALNARAGLAPSESDPQAWTKDANKEYFYIDISYEDLNYRGIYKNDMATWYKFDPIKWRILKEEGGSALVVCETILDVQRYDDDKNDYLDSEIRSYLNGDFSNRVFTPSQQAMIEVTELDNSEASTGATPNQYACENTNDKIFLLSYAEVMNEEIGFNADSTRMRRASDFAVVNGVYTDIMGYGYWWLRSPNEAFGHRVQCVGLDGTIVHNYVYNVNRGVVPALTIRLVPDEGGEE